MNDMMTFPETWEEFEKQYGFADDEEVYTNGSRLIPSFRVRQWLVHLPSVEPKKGKWIPQDHNKRHGNVSTVAYYFPKCSECGCSGSDFYNFCPHCGADMRGGDAK